MTTQSTIPVEKQNYLFSEKIENLRYVVKNFKYSRIYPMIGGIEGGVEEVNEVYGEGYNQALKDVIKFMEVYDQET